MNTQILAAAGAALALASLPSAAGIACERASSAAGETYSGTGTVAMVAGDQVTIARGPNQAIGWPAMTMTFTGSAAMAGAVAAGDQVAFSFRKAGSAYQLTSLQKR